MGAAYQRRSVPSTAAGGGSRPWWTPARRGTACTAALATVVVATLWAVAPAATAQLPAAFWVLAGVAVVVDARPYVLPGRRASSVILPSICCTFAVVLAWGFAAALAVQLVAVTVAGWRMRQPARRTVHLAVQHTVALGAAATVVTVAGVAVVDPGPGWVDAAWIVAAAAAWITAR
ncbi:MAG TPA: GGDEF-domain containing protein, partial [Actinoplanes sp.]|nr:GGDEF-domain containing protein [Actinoplanes sp.]